MTEHDFTHAEVMSVGFAPQTAPLPGSHLTVEPPRIEFRWTRDAYTFHPDGCLDGQIGRTVRLAGSLGQATIVSVRYDDGDAWATFEIGSIEDDLSPDAQVVDHTDPEPEPRWDADL